MALYGFNRQDARTLRRVAGAFRGQSAKNQNVSYGEVFGLQGGATVFLAKVKTTITARSGATPGSGTVDLQTLDSSGDLADATDNAGAVVTKTAKNLSTSSLAVGKYTFCVQDKLTGNLWIVWEDCP